MLTMIPGRDVHVQEKHFGVMIGILRETNITEVVRIEKYVVSLL